MWPIIRRLMGRKQRNASAPIMLSNPGLHLIQGKRSRKAINSAQKHIKHRPQTHSSQDLTRLHKEK